MRAKKSPQGKIICQLEVCISSPSVHFIGLIISRDGVAVDLAKLRPSGTGLLLVQLTRRGRDLSHLMRIDENLYFYFYIFTLFQFYVVMIVGSYETIMRGSG